MTEEEFRLTQIFLKAQEQAKKLGFKISCFSAGIEIQKLIEKDLVDSKKGFFFVDTLGEAYTFLKGVETEREGKLCMK